MRKNIIILIIITSLAFGVTIFSVTYKKSESFQSIYNKTIICKKSEKNRIEYSISCLEDILKTSNDQKISVDVYLKLAENESNLGEYCHQFLHSLGKSLIDKNVVIMQNINDDVKRLSSCGYGFLHGFYENTKLTGEINKDRSVIAESCDRLKNDQNQRIISECYHALGHAVSDKYKNTELSKDVCNQAFEKNIEAKIGCFGGVAMKIRDQLLLEINNGSKFPATVEWFKEVGKNCQSDDQLWIISCAPGFIQLATDQGIEYVKPFLTWCDSTMKISEQCYQQAGVYLGHFSNKLGTPEELINICETSSQNPKYIFKCISSLPEGRMNSGDTKEKAVEFICPKITTNKYCRDTYKLYKYNDNL